MKLSPVTVPFRTLELLFSLVWIAIFVVVVAAPMLDRLVFLGLVAAIVLAVLGTSVAYSVAYYRRFEYAVEPDAFEVAWGVFSRRNREIPYHRIQNVDITRNVLHRLAGIAEVRVETAGGDSTEVHLKYVSSAEAGRLQEVIAERKRAADATEVAEPAEESGRGLFRISPTELALLGVVSFDVRLLALVVAGAAFLDPTTLSELFLAVPALVLAPIAIVAIYLVGAVVSGVVAVTNYYGFTLARVEDELRYHRGLLRQFSGSIPLGKIQSLGIAENVIARQFGYATLTIETAGYSPGEASGSQTAVPLATRTRVFRLAQSIEPFTFPEFERPPKRARERYAVRYAIVVLVATTVAAAVDTLDLAEVPWQATLALLLAVPIAAHLKWRHLGVAVQGEHVITRAGFWTRRTHVVPYHRVQAVIQRQTPFQRRRRLASLRIDTAGSRALVGQDAVAVDIDDDVAAALREHVHDRLQDHLVMRRERSPTVDGRDRAIS